MTRTTEPRTRRQLREALEAARTDNTYNKGRADNAFRLYYCASDALDEAGFTRVDTEDGEKWVAPAPEKSPDEKALEKANRQLMGARNDAAARAISLNRAATALQKLGYIVVNEYSHALDNDIQHFKAPEELPAVTEARHYTLKKVIEALDIPGYRIARSTNPLLANTTLTDQFWEDINTALVVREEAKHAETRAKTEARIAGLAKKVEPAKLSPTDLTLLGDIARSVGNVTIKVPNDPQPTKKRKGDKK